MKRFFLIATVISGFMFTACSSDDDSNDGPICETCELSALGIVFTTEYCDNEDGTITVIFEGIEEVQDLEGVTFDEFISAIEQAGGTCNRS
ncbi:hypothetical protein [uncultured Dokdonia sp.]|uniref:hypothetical protein n=1 Tax=uncultured Dokdonia sp. TaxID=575653 RepID=UPI002632E6F4|nr:hypothetical protein [uncultured Dokdonia sp.]